MPRRIQVAVAQVVERVRLGREDCVQVEALDAHTGELPFEHRGRLPPIDREVDHDKRDTSPELTSAMTVSGTNFQPMGSTSVSPPMTVRIHMKRTPDPVRDDETILHPGKYLTVTRKGRER